MNTDGFKIKLNMSSKVKSRKPVFQRSNCLLLQTDRQYFDFFSSFRILGEVKLDFFPQSSPKTGETARVGLTDKLPKGKSKLEPGFAVMSLQTSTTDT